MVRRRGVFGVMMPRSVSCEHGLSCRENVLASCGNFGWTRRGAVVPRKGDSTGLSIFAGNLVDIPGARQAVGVGCPNGRPLPIKCDPQTSNLFGRHLRDARVDQPQLSSRVRSLRVSELCDQSAHRSLHLNRSVIWRAMRTLVGLTRIARQAGRRQGLIGGAGLRTVRDQGASDPVEDVVDLRETKLHNAKPVSCVQER